MKTFGKDSHKYPSTVGNQNLCLSFDRMLARAYLLKLYERASMSRLILLLLLLSDYSIICNQQD